MPASSSNNTPRRLRQLADANQKVGNKMMTGQYKQSTCNGTYYIQPHKGRRRMIPYTKSYEPKSKPSRQGRIEQSSPDGAIGSARPPVKARLCRARRTIRYLVSC
jgi:hypothetical protein